MWVERSHEMIEEIKVIRNELAKRPNDGYMK